VLQKGLRVTVKLLCQTLEAHCSCNLDDLVQSNRLAVLDVLLFLSVSWWFFEGSDDQGGRGRDDRDGSLTILDCELNCDAETFL